MEKRMSMYLMFFPTGKKLKNQQSLIPRKQSRKKERKEREEKDCVLKKKRQSKM